MKDVLLILTGYLLGSMPWGYWLPRIFKGVNIREAGSGSTGAANVWRTLGFKIGLGVALLDIAKGSAAALLGLWLGGELVGLLAGIAAMAGHWRPVFLGFSRGGKIVATDRRCRAGARAAGDACGRDRLDRHLPRDPLHLGRIDGRGSGRSRSSPSPWAPRSR
jgi:hypothetical protein